MIRDTVRLMGRIAIDENRHAQIRARFPGTVRAVRVQQGDRVRRGQTLVVVEGNDSMRNYTVTAPFDGMVLSRSEEHRSELQSLMRISYAVFCLKKKHQHTNRE